MQGITSQTIATVAISNAGISKRVWHGLPMHGYLATRTGKQYPSKFANGAFSPTAGDGGSETVAGQGTKNCPVETGEAPACSLQCSMAGE